jgi:hypothetical protein
LFLELFLCSTSGMCVKVALPPLQPTEVHPRGSSVEGAALHAAAEGCNRVTLGVAMRQQYGGCVVRWYLRRRECREEIVDEFMREASCCVEIGGKSNNDCMQRNIASNGRNSQKTQDSNGNRQAVTILSLRH